MAQFVWDSILKKPVLKMKFSETKILDSNLNKNKEMSVNKRGRPKKKSVMVVRHG